MLNMASWWIQTERGAGEINECQGWDNWKLKQEGDLSYRWRFSCFSFILILLLFVNVYIIINKIITQLLKLYCDEE